MIILKVPPYWGVSVAWVVVVDVNVEVAATLEGVTEGLDVVVALVEVDCEHPSIRRAQNSKVPNSTNVFFISDLLTISKNYVR